MPRSRFRAPSRPDLDERARALFRVPQADHRNLDGPLPPLSVATWVKHTTNHLTGKPLRARAATRRPLHDSFLRDLYDLLTPRPSNDEQATRLIAVFLQSSRRSHHCCLTLHLITAKPNTKPRSHPAAQPPRQRPTQTRQTPALSGDH